MSTLSDRGPGRRATRAFLPVGLAGLLLVALAVTAVLLFSDSEATARVRYVSPRGSNHNPGTALRPWRTIRYAARRAQPGDTVVIRAGHYGRRGTRFTITRGGLPGKPIVFRGAGGRLPRIYGRFKIEASHVSVARVHFVGPTGAVSPRTASNPGGEDVLVWITGSDVELRGDTVDNSAWHAGVFVQGGQNVRLITSAILHNGAFGRADQANLDHGIYWAAGSGSIIGCVVAGSVASGIQLYPDAANVSVLENVIIGNGKAGVLLSGAAAHNVVAGNKITSNKGYGIQTYGLTGVDNHASANLLTGNLSDAIPPELLP
jgi:parallel beta-helix repeat protein